MPPVASGVLALLLGMSANGAGAHAMTVNHAPPPRFLPWAGVMPTGNFASQLGQTRDLFGALSAPIDAPHAMAGHLDLAHPLSQLPPAHSCKAHTPWANGHEPLPERAPAACIAPDTSAADAAGAVQMKKKEVKSDSSQTPGCD